MRRGKFKKCQNLLFGLQNKIFECLLQALIHHPFLSFTFLDILKNIKRNKEKPDKYLIYYIFICFFFFQKHSKSTEQQGKGKAIPLTLLLHFHLLCRYFEINWTITGENSSRHIAARLEQETFVYEVQVTANQ